MKNVVAVGGNWMAQPEWIASGQFDRIRDAVRDTVTRVAALTQRPVGEISARRNTPTGQPRLEAR
jgi:hypothetical protein